MEIDKQLLSLLGLMTYLVSLFMSVLLISPKRITNFFLLKYFLPVFFILIVALYVIPLSVFNYSLSEPSGNISPHFYSFSGYIPFALLLCAVFNLVFSFSYRKLVLRKVFIEPSHVTKKFSRHEFLIIYIFLIVSVWLLYQLSKEVGGLLGLILSGYRVTELFINKGHYAVGFEWIVTLCLLLWGNALTTKSIKRILSIGLLLVVVTTAFAIMGRRGALVILIGSSIYLFHQLYKPIKLYKLIGIGITGFYFLTLVGFLRGDSYENLSTFVQTIQEKKIRIDNDKSVDFLYTVTTGNFAVPFETFPQVIKSLGNEYNLGFGFYSMQSFLIIIPSALWSDRPLPLSNWYMKTFYGTTQFNEGRQFFLLSAPYMDFGPSGIVLIGIVFAFFWGIILKIGTEHKNDILSVTFISIIIASSLNLVSNDFAGWIIAFSKGYGFPIFLIFLIRKMHQLYQKYRQ